jgi:transcriptional regulator with XRE-family HTH domain
LTVGQVVDRVLLVPPTPKKRKRIPRRSQERGVNSYNRVVAYNLKEAREARKWKQEEAAERLEQLTGVRWSKVTWSAAEASHTAPAERVRIFSVDDLVNFARLFDKPVGWFLVPPPTGGDTPPWTAELLASLLWVYPIAQRAAADAWGSTRETGHTTDALEAWHGWLGDLEPKLREQAERVTVTLTDSLAPPGTVPTPEPGAAQSERMEES